MNSVNSAMLYKTDLSKYLYMLCSEIINVFINFIFSVFNSKTVTILILFCSYTYIAKRQKNGFYTFV